MKRNRTVPLAWIAVFIAAMSMFGGVASGFLSDRGLNLGARGLNRQAMVSNPVFMFNPRRLHAVEELPRPVRLNQPIRIL